MGNKTTKFWSLGSGDPAKRTLFATFKLKDGKLVSHTVENEVLKDLIKEGFYNGKEQVTLESDAAQFLELLEGDYSRSSYIDVEIDED